MHQDPEGRISEMQDYDVVVGYSEVCVTVEAHSWREAENIVRRRLGMLRPGNFSTAVIEGSEPAIYSIECHQRDPHPFDPYYMRLTGFPYEEVRCCECDWNEVEHNRRFA